MLRYTLPTAVIAICVIATILGGLQGLVTVLLVGVSGGVVVALMYFGTREQHHDENVSDQPHV